MIASREHERVRAGTVAGPPGDPVAPWRVLLGPCPLGEARVEGVRRAVSSAPDRPYPPDRLAGEIVAALAAGERVLLASGPWELGSTLGDPYMARAVALLPREPPAGVVVGAFHHAHALTELALRAPAVATYTAPPLAESLAAAGDREASCAWRAMSLLGTSVEQLWQIPHRAHIGYARPPLRGRPAQLPPCREVAPRTLREGYAHGPLLAGNLLALSFAVPRWRAYLDSAILAIEIAGAQLRMIDRYMQRLALLGVLDRIGALLIGVPFDLVAERPALELDEIVLRAVGHRSCAVVADAFVGTGLPGTHMRLGADEAVTAWGGGSRIAAAASHPTASSASAVGART